MHITTNNYSISELMGMLDRGELKVNSQYQRGAGIWPPNPSSYFIDTIIENYPCPKIYLYEYQNRVTRTPAKEIVDGQQRIGTIRRFIDDEFTIVGESKHVGLKFSDLDPDMQDAFMSYTISADVIRMASPGEILQMFRRMNAYTLPLNSAEKRHSSFQGKFKWSVNGITDSLSDFFQEYGVFTPRQIVRMADAELVADCILSIKDGLVSTSEGMLRSLYERYNIEYPEENLHREMILESVNFIIANFSGLRNSYLMKPYALYSLIIAMAHAKYDLPSIERVVRARGIGRFASDPTRAASDLLALAQAHETKDLDGPYGKYVWGSIGGTNRLNRRLARVAAILRALGVNVPRSVDEHLS